MRRARASASAFSRRRSAGCALPRRPSARPAFPRMTRRCARPWRLSPTRSCPGRRAAPTAARARRGRGLDELYDPFYGAAAAFPVIHDDLRAHDAAVLGPPGELRPRPSLSPSASGSSTDRMTAAARAGRNPICVLYTGPAILVYIAYYGTRAVRRSGPRYDRLPAALGRLLAGPLLPRPLPGHDEGRQPALMAETTDVCVIGSGFGGAILAYYLARAGPARGRARARTAPLRRLAAGSVEPQQLLEVTPHLQRQRHHGARRHRRRRRLARLLGRQPACPELRLRAHERRQADLAGDAVTTHLDPYYRRAERGLGVHQLGFEEVASRGGTGGCG